MQFIFLPSQRRCVVFISIKFRHTNGHILQATTITSIYACISIYDFESWWLFPIFLSNSCRKRSKSLWHSILRTHSFFNSCNNCVKLRLSRTCLSLSMASFTLSSHRNDGHNSIKASISSPLCVDLLFMILSHNSWHSSDNNAFDLSVRWPIPRKVRNNGIATGWLTIADADIMLNCSICSAFSWEQPQKQRNTRWSTVAATGDESVCRRFCTCSKCSSDFFSCGWCCRCRRECECELLLLPSSRWDIFQLKIEYTALCAHDAMLA